MKPAPPMSQSGYIGIVATVFVVVMGVIFLNSTSKYLRNTAPADTTIPETETLTFCEEVSGTDAVSFTGPQDKATKCPNGPDGSYKSGGDFRNNFQGSTTYRVVRKNVPLNVEFFQEGSPHSVLASNVGINANLDPTKYRVYFPEISGEIKVQNAVFSRTRDCGDRSYRERKLLYFIDYGMAFGLILKNGNPIEIRGKDMEGDDTTFWLVDVFKDEKRDDIPQEAFQCSASTDTNITPLGVTIPNQQESLTEKQLQLEYFTFGQQISNGAVLNGWRDTCKPAIYLYPKKPTLVNVKVYPQGMLTYTDPIYDLNKGWTVTANPDGKLESGITNYELRNYDYLYYESKIKDQVIKKPNEGWIIKSNAQNDDWFKPLENDFQNLLPRLGLNSIQTKDFIEYWKKALPYSPYYFIGIVDQNNINEFERLEITPKPDSINRVRIYFEALPESKTVTAPVLTSNQQPAASNQFSVVEWGGMVKLDKDHPFTCSQ